MYYLLLAITPVFDFVEDDLLTGDALSAFIALSPLAIAAVAAWVALLTHRATQRERANDRKREICARAMADALAWLELPYRIRRRVDDTPETLAALSNRLHDLQESLLFHVSWLQVELPRARDSYQALMDAVKAAAGPHIQDAWRHPPVNGPVEMNVGDLGIPRDDALEKSEAFGALVRKSLS